MQRDFPVGSIQSWSGSIVDIPSRWRLCDGLHGTPDLRDKFIVGSGTTYDPADTGGNVNHNHPFTVDVHLHTQPAGSDLTLGPAKNASGSALEASGTSDNSDGRPPYFAKAFIMYTGVSI